MLDFIFFLLIHWNKFVFQTILYVEWLGRGARPCTICGTWATFCCRSLHKRRTLKYLRDCELWYFQLFPCLFQFSLHERAPKRATMKKLFYGNLWDVDKVSDAVEKFSKRKLNVLISPHLTRTLLQSRLYLSWVIAAAAPDPITIWRIQRANN